MLQEICATNGNKPFHPPDNMSVNRINNTAILVHKDIPSSMNKIYCVENSNFIEVTEVTVRPLNLVENIHIFTVDKHIDNNRKRSAESFINWIEKQSRLLNMIISSFVVISMLKFLALATLRKTCGAGENILRTIDLTNTCNQVGILPILVGQMTPESQEKPQLITQLWTKGHTYITWSSGKLAPLPTQTTHKFGWNLITLLMMIKEALTAWHNTNQRKRTGVTMMQSILQIKQQQLFAKTKTISMTLMKLVVPLGKLYFKLHLSAI